MGGNAPKTRCAVEQHSPSVASLVVIFDQGNVDHLCDAVRNFGSARFSPSPLKPECGNTSEHGNSANALGKRLFFIVCRACLVQTRSGRRTGRKCKLATTRLHISKDTTRIREHRRK